MDRRAVAHGRIDIDLRGDAGGALQQQVVTVEDAEKWEPEAFVIIRENLGVDPRCPTVTAPIGADIASSSPMPAAA